MSLTESSVRLAGCKMQGNQELAARESSGKTVTATIL